MAAKARVPETGGRIAAPHSGAFILGASGARTITMRITTIIALIKTLKTS
jgi:hypothetical protein